MVSWILFLEETSETSPSNAAQVQELLAGDAWHLSSPSPRMPQGSRENPWFTQPCTDPRSGPLGSCSTGVTSAPK